MSDQQRPLWEVMRDAYTAGYGDALESEAPALVIDRVVIQAGYAAEIRAIADTMVLVFDPWLQEHSDVADWLYAEADRAEAGE